MVDGFTVICDDPDPETCPLVTSIVSTVELSEVFLIVIFPLSASTLSLKFSTIFASLATPESLLAGVAVSYTHLTLPTNREV